MTEAFHTHKAHGVPKMRHWPQVRPGVVQFAIIKRGLFQGILNVYSGNERARDTGISTRQCC